MAKVSELITKYVISLYNGQEEGIIENVLFNCQTYKAQYFIVYNLNNEITYLLPTNKLYKIGTDAVTIRNSSSALSLYENNELEISDLNNPINASAFKIDGSLLGVVTDIELDDKYVINSIQLNNTTEVQKEQILSLNSNTVLINDPEQNINIKNFFERKKNIQDVSDSRIVNIMEINQIAEKQPVPSTIINGQLIPTGTQLPNRAITNYNFLINRKVQKNIMSTQGNLIIKQNTKINTNTINVARLNGKLKELTKYSI